MSTPTHSPLPWKAIPLSDLGKISVVDRDGKPVCPCVASHLSQAQNEANAALVASVGALIASRSRCVEALRGVLRVADRATVEFDAARAAIAECEGSK